MTNEKPSEVRAGQRWQENDDAATPYTVTAVDPAKGAQLEFDDHAPTGGYWYRLDSVLEDRFLGYAPGFGPPIGDRPVPAAGQRWRDGGRYTSGPMAGKDAAGAPFFGGEAFTLTGQDEVTGGWHDDRSRTPWNAQHFTNGRLVFVDHGPSLTPAPTAAPAMCGAEVKHGGLTFRCQMIGPHDDHISGAAAEDGSKTHRWSRTATPVPVRRESREVDPYADGAFTFEGGEKTLHEHGTPLTCLQRVAPRKPPEPWRPSCDDDYWLADAGTSYRSGR